MTIRILAMLAVAALTACSAPGGATAGAAPNPSGGKAGTTLAAYRSDDELSQALERWRAEAARHVVERRRASPMALQESATLSAPAPAPAMAPAAPAAAAKAADSSAGASSDSITNVQTAGVDEGGIVKRAGDFLVVLRRGRLFTVRVGGDALEPVSMTDAFAPDADPRGAWYDELLVSGRSVVVVGYSYARGGTEIGLFELDGRGALHYRQTYHLRSFDYYSARNYASRLVGNRLVFYSPTLLRPYGPPPMQMLPGLRRWQGPSTPDGWQRILPAQRIYRTDDDFDPGQPLALHNVTGCDLGEATLRCESTAVLGPAGRVFYVSQGSVFVWTSAPAAGRAESVSAVFRIPLDGGAPTALKTVGVPLDQLSFLEDAGGHLNVLLRATGAGEGMWGHLRAQGRTALLRVPLSAFGDGREAARREHYRVLPGSAWTQNRFVGDWLLWGGPRRAPARDAAPDASAPAWAVCYASAHEARPLDPGHGIERIEALGAHALLVGNQGRDLHFSAVRLARDEAALAGGYVVPEARQGETRTHGFFYRPDGDGRDGGLLGLPIVDGGQRSAPVPRGAQAPAAVVFLRERGLGFHGLGELRAAGGPVLDACRASCVDWYGNARPLFLGSRIVALLGYELVEGRLDGGAGGEAIVERRRVSFAPRLGAEGGRASPFSP